MASIPSPTKEKAPVITRHEHLTVDDLNRFMKKHGFGEKEFSELLGVTPQAVRLWLSGARDFSVTNSRLIKMLDKYPQLIREF